MKTAIGYLAILLGVAAQVKNRPHEITAQADQGLRRVEDTLARMHEKARATAVLLTHPRPPSSSRVKAVLPLTSHRRRPRRRQG